MSETTAEASEKSAKKKVLSYALVGGGIFFVLGLNPVYQRMIGEWPLPVAAFFADNLLPYVAVCLAISILSVVVAFARFPKAVVPVTIAATLLSLSGPVAAGKVARDAQVRQVMTDEAANLSAKILKLQGLKGDDLRMEGRAIMLGVFVSLFGEEAMRESSFNPTPDEIARRAAQSNHR